MENIFWGSLNNIRIGEAFAAEAEGPEFRSPALT